MGNEDGQRKASQDHELSPHTGAEVIGVDLAQSLRPAVRMELAWAFIQHAKLTEIEVAQIRCYADPSEAAVKSRTVFGQTFDGGIIDDLSQN